MHPPILVSRGTRRARRAIAAAALAASSLAVARPLPAADCPARAGAVVERFMVADCPDCWRATPAAAAPGDWSLDWIVPAADDAPMAPAALPEAQDRLARLNPGLPARLRDAPDGFEATDLLHPPPAGRHRFYVHSSLPHNGYLGVQMHASGRWPEGSTGWIALVETIAPGVRGTPVTRRLVRVLVGPLALPGSANAADAVAPLYGLRWPENAHPDQLVATAWVEDADGRITQIATDRCADPK